MKYILINYYKLKTYDQNYNKHKKTTEQKIPVGYFKFHNNNWVIVIQKLASLKDVTEDNEIPIGAMVD